MRKLLLVSMLLLGAITIRNVAWGQQPSNIAGRTDISVTGTITQLCPINGSRVDCSCTNNDSANAIRVGGSTITATRGQRVPAGATFKAVTTSAVFGVAEGASVSMSCTDQSR
jgi:non-ribosomal peptide synthetase component E (peptide arylation enzyme)